MLLEIELFKKKEEEKEEEEEEKKRKEKKKKSNLHHVWPIPIPISTTKDVICCSINSYIYHFLDYIM